MPTIYLLLMFHTTMYMYVFAKVINLGLAYIIITVIYCHEVFIAQITIYSMHIIIASVVAPEYSDGSGRTHKVFLRKTHVCHCP